MNKIIQWIKNLWNRLFHKPAQTASASTVPAPKPEQVTVERMTFKHPLGIGHSMHRLKGIGGHRVRPVCSTRAFKENFYKEFGVRLT